MSNKRTFNDAGVGGSGGARSRSRLLDPPAAAAAAAASAPERNGQLARAFLTKLPPVFAAQIMEFLDNSSMASLATTSRNQMEAAQTQPHAHLTRGVEITDPLEGEALLERRDLRAQRSDPKDRKWLQDTFLLVLPNFEFHLTFRCVVGNEYYMEGDPRKVEEQRAGRRRACQLAALARTLHEYTTVDLYLELHHNFDEDSMNGVLDPPGLVRFWDDRSVVYIPPSLPDLKATMLTINLDLEDSAWFSGEQNFDFLRCRRAPRLDTLRFQARDVEDGDEGHWESQAAGYPLLVLGWLKTPMPARRDGAAFCTLLAALDLLYSIPLVDTPDFVLPADWHRKFVDNIIALVDCMLIGEITVHVGRWHPDVRAQLGPRCTQWEGGDVVLMEPEEDREEIAVARCIVQGTNGNTSRLAFIKPELEVEGEEEEEEAGAEELDEEEEDEEEEEEEGEDEDAE